MLQIWTAVCQLFKEDIVLLTNSLVSDLPTQSFTKEFVDALLGDILKLAVLMVEKVFSLKAFEDQILPPNIAVAAQNLSKAIQISSNLNAHPELFASEELRSKFLEIMSELSLLVAIMFDVLDLKQVYDNMMDIIPQPQVNSTDVEHPALQSGKKLWNKWLDNTATPVPGCIVIDQKIPRIGHLLMRRITLEYEAIEADFQDVGLSLLTGEHSIRITLI